MHFNEYCANRLQEERLRLGFTQQEIAELVEIRGAMWGRYERNEAAPGGEVLTAFAKAGGDVQYVLIGVRSSNALAPDEAELLAGYRGLDIRAKANMLGMLDVVSTTSTAQPIVSGRHNIGSVQFHGKIAQHITGGINAPQTINMGGRKKKKNTIPE